MAERPFSCPAAKPRNHDHSARRNGHRAFPREDNSNALHRKARCRKRRQASPYRGDGGAVDGVANVNASLRNLPIEERIRLVEDLWDSIAEDRQTLPLSDEQRAELDRRLDRYGQDADDGRPAADVLDGIRKNL